MPAGSPPVRVVAAPFPGTVSGLVVQAAMWNLKGFSLYLLLFPVKDGVGGWGPEFGLVSFCGIFASPYFSLGGV